MTSMKKHADNEFASRLFDALAGHTQEELARGAGVTQGAVSRWLAGGARPHRKTAQRVADALGVELRWLMEGEGPKLNARSRAIGEQIFTLLGVGVESVPDNELHEPEADVHNPMETIGEELQIIAHSLTKIGIAMALLSHNTPQSKRIERE